MGLGGTGLGDGDAPDLRTLLQVVPGIVAGVLGVEHVAQRLRVVVVDQLDGLAGGQVAEGGEDQGEALLAGELAHIDPGGGGCSGHGGSVVRELIRCIYNAPMLSSGPASTVAPNPRCLLFTPFIASAG